MSSCAPASTARSSRTVRRSRWSRSGWPATAGYTEFDVSHELRGFGWQVPAYTMPDNATDVAVLRIVVREGLSADLARALHDDARSALTSLDKLKPGGHYKAEHFAHQ